MWSLPNIAALNDAAHRRACSTKPLEWYAEHLRDPETEEPAVCSHHDDRCQGELRAYLWYDIFSDDPKGILFLCAHHDGYYGSPDEGFFFCDDCGRVFIENYTWELYTTYDEDAGSLLCLNCYAQRMIHDPQSWIPLDEESIEALDFERVRQAKHIFAVEGPRHGLIQVGESALFDSMTGGTVRTTSDADPTPDRGIAQLKEALRIAREQGYARALLVLDGAYQFCVSIAVYVNPRERKTAYGTRGGRRRRK